MSSFKITNTNFMLGFRGLIFDLPTDKVDYFVLETTV